MQIYLYEDGAGDLEPLTLSRPVFDLRCGAMALASRQLHHFSARAPSGIFLRDHLAAVWRQEHPGMAVNDPVGKASAGVVVVNGRWLPPPKPSWSTNEIAIGCVDDEVAWAILGPEQACGLSPANLAMRLESFKKSLPRRNAGGRLLRFPWDLVEQNGGQICQDFDHCAAHALGRIDAAVAVVGPRERLWVAKTAHLDPMVVVDTRSGPVIIDEHANITAFTRIEGPCYIGRHTHILSARLRRGTSLGPQCRIGGEVEASIVHSHSNKYHDGFLGHAYVGSWVNLGAGTSNSDLRNDYGSVQVSIRGELHHTGLSKVGCFIGDHSKTGLGTLLNTGSSVGIFCNLLPAGRLAPRHVPSFTTWWHGSLRESADWTPLMTTARTVMNRRGRQLTEAHVALYLHVFDQTALERRRVLHDADGQARRRAG